MDGIVPKTEFLSMFFFLFCDSVSVSVCLCLCLCTSLLYSVVGSFFFLLHARFLPRALNSVFYRYNLNIKLLATNMHSVVDEPNTLSSPAPKPAHFSAFTVTATETEWRALGWIQYAREAGCKKWNRDPEQPLSYLNRSCMKFSWRICVRYWATNMNCAEANKKQWHKWRKKTNMHDEQRENTEKNWKPIERKWVVKDDSGACEAIENGTGVSEQKQICQHSRESLLEMIRQNE